MTTKNPTTKEKKLIKRIYELVQTNAETRTRIVPKQYIPAHIESDRYVPAEYRTSFREDHWVPSRTIPESQYTENNVFANKSPLADFQKAAKDVAKLVNGDKKQRHRTHEALVEIAQSLTESPDSFTQKQELWATFKYAVAEGYYTLYPAANVAAIVNEKQPEIKNPFAKKKR